MIANAKMLTGLDHVASARRDLFEGNVKAAFLALPPAETESLLEKMISGRSRVIVWAEKPWTTSVHMATLLTNQLDMEILKVLRRVLDLGGIVEEPELAMPAGFRL